ncbi:E3 ubiquitin-protein ligase SH3RF3 isoform X2 [Leptidea sinapis]|uniref:E3 ubiquitin-protein ligase SH3RF3 isoform X2 n=1 Tax=Leptidea sinapis TaxID=189913 RepID=UPI0021246904|nr:E3 ubiquitin-protein ligase SH3RF3 isoform X2 [Leptidea sinapis]
MDEGLLNDLLECSVCLERLDTSSRVLPCQHTFCLKCLKVIVESHKELRCPECRVLVEARVEELPPNVLLMRILEGMKNSAPRRVVGARLRTAQTQPQVSQQGRSDGKQLPPHGRALYDYISKEPGDLSFKKGEVILLQKKLDAFWYHGECSTRSGMFPINYVQVVVPLPTPTALCKALYDFRMSAPDEEGCLAFDKGAIIKVERRVDENWAEGRVEQRLGIFPIAFVELNHAARMLLNNTPVNRQVPPIPDQSRNAHSDHRHSQHPQRYQQLSISTPSSAQGNYQNMSALSQSQPSHTNHPSNVNHPPQTLAPNQNVIRNLVEPQTKYLMDIIHFTNAHTMGIQSVSRPNDNTDRIRATKLDSYSQKEYANVRHDVTINFNSNISSDSSSSMNTPSVGSTTTPNTSSNTSTCESAEPSLPSSPDNNTDRNTTVVAKEESQDLNASMGVLSLNESSTATNTSLNVSLPLESQLNVSNASSSSQNAAEANESTNDSGPTSLPCTSKAVRSGPDSLLNFGLGLQAALSPAHSKDSYAMARHRDHREKRHSLTPSTHLQANHTQNRHSAEILATSLLDHTPERDRDRPERERRRRRSRSNERPLPAAYVALYPYKPQKPDELELKKGGVYTVRERCRDGWYKGWCERLQRSGVFPGNYVAPLTPLPTARIKHDKSIPSPSATNTKAAPVVVAAAGSSAGVCAAPDAPPRANSPLANAGQPLSYPWHLQTQTQQAAARSDKSKDKSKPDKSSISTGVSLMKRLAAMKKCKSPPPVSAGYSMDNPVFEDNTTVAHYPVHVRRGSSEAGSPWQSQHRKSQSLDVTAARRDRHHSQTVKERFRCIAPYPPNSEYELELKVDDIVIVCKKRGDGWYKGTLQRTGRTGLFPASFVQSYPND